MWNYHHRIFGLDLLRALAITLVVVSHCTYILPEFNPQLTTTIRLFGATGVDLFFVLSGYLIGGLLIKKLELGKTRIKDLFQFWKRRWLRTLPNYVTVLILNILLILILNEQLVNKIWLYIPFFQNFTAIHPNFFTEAWSLSIEEYAYIILPLFFYLVLWLFKSKNPVKLFFQISLLVIGLLYILKLNFYVNADITSYKDWSRSFRKVVIYRLDAIYIGFVMISLSRKYELIKSWKGLFLIMGLLVFLILHFMIFLFNLLPETYPFFYTCVYLILISVSIALVFPYVIHLGGKRVFKTIIQYISTRSYAIYLVNYSLVLLTIKRFIEPSLLSMFIYLLITFFASELLYRFIEVPFLKYRDKRIPR
jgi:peptidoglycan/LPS O-acetylase OafA/YrhL